MSNLPPSTISTGNASPDRKEHDSAARAPQTTSQTTSGQAPQMTSGRAPQTTSGRGFSLRNRLIVTLILFSIVPIILIAIISIVLETNSTRQRLENTLNAVITLKESQVNQWTQDIQASLNAEIERDTDTRRMFVLLRTQPVTAVFQAVYGEQLDIFNSVIASRARFDELMLVNAKGVIILSTSKDQEGKVVLSRDFFRLGMQGAVIMPPTYDLTLGKITVIAAQPVKSDRGEVLGIIAGRVNLDALNTIMLERTGIGDTGETYLVAKNYLLLTDARQPGYPVGETYIRSEAATRAIEFQGNGNTSYANYADVPVLGAFRWIPSLEIALIAEQNQSEAFASLTTTTNLSIAAAFAMAIIALLAAYLISSNLTQPLAALTATAQQIAASAQSGAIPSEVASRATQRNDEIGALANAFNIMTGQVRQLIENLEQRVNERTGQLRVRSEQLQAAAEVGRSVTTILDIDQLLQQVVDLIQQRFDLYYVGLFLVDDARQWAVLKAGTGRAGQAMLIHNRRLKVGEGLEASPSMIGWSITNAQARIALEAGEDPVRLATEDLPDTRSEAAIPLRSRGQVIGAISIQSRLPGAFDRETVAIFQTMADQIAVAIDNARLFAESQKALDAVQQAYGRLSHQAWIEKLSAAPMGFRRDQSGLARITSATLEGGAAKSMEAVEPEIGATPNNSAIAIPIKARGQVIGYINAQKRASAFEIQQGSVDKGMGDNGGGGNNGGVEGDTPAPAETTTWNEQEINLLETIVDQLGITLDSARLFEETQLQAERERLVSEITSRMRATLDIDNVLQTAAREMLNALDLAEVEVRMAPTGAEYSASGVDSNASGADSNASGVETGALEAGSPTPAPQRPADRASLDPLTDDEHAYQQTSPKGGKQ